MKFKFFLKKANPELKTDADIKKMDVHKKALSMLLFHNQKVDTIQNKYKQANDDDDELELDLDECSGCLIDLESESDDDM